MVFMGMRLTSEARPVLARSLRRASHPIVEIAAGVTSRHPHHSAGSILLQVAEHKEVTCIVVASLARADKSLHHETIVVTFGARLTLGSCRSAPMRFIGQEHDVSG